MRIRTERKDTLSCDGQLLKGAIQLLLQPPPSQTGRTSASGRPWELGVCYVSDLKNSMVKVITWHRQYCLYHNSSFSGLTRQLGFSSWCTWIRNLSKKPNNPALLLPIQTNDILWWLHSYSGDETRDSVREGGSSISSQVLVRCAQRISHCRGEEGGADPEAIYIYIYTPSSLVAPPYRGEGVWVRQEPWELYQR
jgi:hypothetical protein